MPFKAGKSPQDAANNVQAKIKQVTDEKLEAALTTVAYAIGAKADFYVPVDTNALMNSRAIKIIPHEGGFRATIGYYQDYAAALHGTASYSPLWRPMTPEMRAELKSAKNYTGRPTGGFNIHAKPGWIFRGVEYTDVQGLFKKAMTI